MARRIQTSSANQMAELKLSEREQLLLVEIGGDEIDTATSFVNYINEEYGFSKSAIWYNLNQLKQDGLVEFANKDETGKPLTLTKDGMRALDTLNVVKNALVERFSNMFLEKVREMQKTARESRYNGYGYGSVGYAREGIYARN